MRHSLTTALGLAAGTMLFAATPAAAQNVQSWVSSSGSDAAACTRAAPCATFTAALAVTNAGGQINCVDRANYGAVTIGKAVTIECSIGGITVTSGNAVTIAAGASDVVTLRGLQLDGALASTGSGVSFSTGGKVILDRVNIRNFVGDGILYQPTANTQLFVIKSVISNNRGAGGGINIFPGIASSTMGLWLSQVTIEGNTGAGVRIKTTRMTGGGVAVQLRDTTIAGNAYGVIATTPPGTGVATVSVQDSEVANNSSAGLAVSGAFGQMVVTNTVISGSATGLSRGDGGTIVSTGDNLLTGNTYAGAFSSTITTQ